MAIDIGSPETWRNRTAGGVPYRIMEGYPKFKFTESGASAEEKYLIVGRHLAAFALESLPPPSQVLDLLGGGNTGRPYPGLPRLVTRELDAEPFDQSKPGDPLLTDDSEASGTYSPFYVVTINYSTREQEDEEEDEDDLETILTHDIQAGAEFIIIPPDNLSSADEGDEPDDDQDGEVRATGEDGEPYVPGGGDAAKNPVKKTNVPISKILPTIEHTLTWTRCPNPPWGQMRNALGKLNSDRLPIFFNAPAGTVLFLGFSAKQEWEWVTRERSSAGYRIRPWTVTLKFSERALIERGKRITWNHVFIPGKDHNRFEKVYLDPPANTRTIYESVPFLNIFKVDKPENTLPETTTGGLGIDLDRVADGDIGR